MKQQRSAPIPENIIRQYALRRLAEVLHVHENSLSNDDRFGRELKAVRVSDFESNEFDKIDDDIRGVADKRALKEMSRGSLVIHTVNDYCNHMVRCSLIKPDDVVRVLGIP